MDVCIYICIYINPYIYIYIYMCVNIYTYICKYIYEVFIYIRSLEFMHEKEEKKRLEQRKEIRTKNR
jgi:hypothetical protein